MAPVPHSHNASGGSREIEMSSKANGQGYTYKVGKSYRTVIRRCDQSVIAMASTAQLSRQRAKEKIEKLPKLPGNKN